MFKINLPDDVKTILSTLHSAGYTAYVVGGCVRDSLLNRTPNDWDICTAATPDKMLELFTEHNYKTIPTGIKHGTITVMINDVGYECTTYRIDGDYSDGRHPDSVSYTDDIKEDLKRRDFTINAMAYNDETGLVDPYGGHDDLVRKTIRCVGHPDHRFTEDALRIMRALRFSAQFDFQIEDFTRIRANTFADNLDNIAAERINSELCKMIVSPSANNVIEQNMRVILKVIPELKAAVDFEQNNPYHDYTVFGHTMKALSRCESNDLTVRLAVLLHDIGKPSCYQDDTDGHRHFKGHGKVSSEIAENILRRLKFDNETVANVIELIKYHDSTFEVRKKHIRRWLNKIGETQFRRLLAVRIADVKGQKDCWDPERIDKVTAITALLDEILEEKSCFSMKDLAVNGRDLIEIGYKADKKLGETLNFLLNEVMDENVPNDKDALISIAKERLNDE